MVDDPASPATWDAASSEIPRFMREVLERHARPAELRSVVDVLRARDVPGLFVDALRRVDGLNRADPTAERNAVECICATAAVLGVILGDDDEWDGKGDGDAGVEVENPREETRGERRSVPGGVSDAVRAERRDARDVRREFAEGLMRADAVGATLWALSALLDRHPASLSPPPVPRSPETRNPEPDLVLEPSGVLWSFLAVVLGALGPDIVPRTIRGEMHRPPRWLTAVEWSPAGVFYAFSAAHDHAESPENRRDRDVAGDILVACLFARIAREPTRDGSYSATGLTDGGPRGDALLRECAGYFLDHLVRRAGASAGGERRDWHLDGGTAAILSLVVWNECVRLGAPVDPMVEEYLMAHYARAFGPASRGEGFPRGEGFAALVAFGKSGSADAAARAWDRVSRAGARRPGSATWRANGRFLIAVLRPSSTGSGGYDGGQETSRDDLLPRLGDLALETSSRLAVTRNDFRRFEEAFGDDIAHVTLAQTLCREGDDLERVDARVAREALVGCMDARAPPSRAATAVRGETWRECAAAAATLDPRSPVLDDAFAVAAAATTLNAHLRRTHPEFDTSKSQQYALGDGTLPSRVKSTTRGFYGDDFGAAAARFARACRRGVGVERRTAVVALLFDDLIAEAMWVDTARGDEPPARTFRVHLASEAMRTARRRGDDGSGASPEKAKEVPNALTIVSLVVASVAILDVPFLCDVCAGLGNVGSLDRATTFDVLGTLVERFGFDRIDSKRLARIRRVARAGTCAGETEMEREAAAGCLRAALLATSARADPEEDDETLWELGVVEEWLVGTVPGIEPTTGTTAGETDARLALLATVARRVPGAFERAFGSRDAATRAAATAAAAMETAGDQVRPGALDALRALFREGSASSAVEGAVGGAVGDAVGGARGCSEVDRRPGAVASAMAPEDLAGVREVVASRRREVMASTRRRPDDGIAAMLARNDDGETRATGLWSTVARVGYDSRGELTALTRDVDAVVGRVDGGG